MNIQQMPYVHITHKLYQNGLQYKNIFYSERSHKSSLPEIDCPSGEV